MEKITKIIKNIQMQRNIAITTSKTMIKISAQVVKKFSFLLKLRKNILK